MISALKIALVHPFSWPEVRRGGERYLADLQWYLVRAGHRVEVITGTAGRTGRSRSGATTTHRLRHIRSTRLARRGYAEAETFGARAFPLLLRRRFDVVHALTPTAAVAAGRARQRTLYTVLGHPSRALVDALPFESGLIRKAIRSATVVAALSESSALATEEAFGRRPLVLPPGVVLDRFPLRDEPRLGPPRVLFPAFASNPQKGLGTLVEAFAMMLERLPDARLVLAGPGDHDWAFDRLAGRDAARVRAATEVVGVGTIEDLPARYATSTVTALPSTNEAFGLILLESLATGTPVVGGDGGGIPEIVDRPEVGRTVPFGDARALAGALEATIVCARDPRTPARCRARAERWGWVERVGAQHEAVYRQLAHGGRTPPRSK